MRRKIQAIGVFIVGTLFLTSQLALLPASAYNPNDEAAIQNNYPSYEPTDCSLPEGQNANGGQAGGGGGTNNGGSGSSQGGSPTGLETPTSLSDAAMAGAINKYIAEKFPNSPMKGLGEEIVAAAKQAGVNPFLIVAIAQNESSMGTAGDLSKPPANNVFGRTASARQPHVGTGDSLFYKWDSVAASVDPNNPANQQDPANSGDMATYLANVYGDQIQANDYEAFANQYAPPHENNTAQYATNLRQTIQTLASYAAAAPDGGGNADTGGEQANSGSGNTNAAAANGGDPEVCKTPGDQDGDGVPDDQGGGSGDTGDGPANEVPADLDSTTCKGGGSAAATAVCFSWPEYHRPNYTTKKKSYADAIAAARKRGEYVGGCVGVDCGAFTTRAMRDSGADPQFNKSNCNTSCQWSYMRNSNKYQSLGNVTSSSKLQPGDIAINDGHTYMWVGKFAGFAEPVASASLCGRAPMAGLERPNGNFAWYRLTR